MLKRIGKLVVIGRVVVTENLAVLLGKFNETDKIGFLKLILNLSSVKFLEHDYLIKKSL
jgi:hypothetical protein